LFTVIHKPIYFNTIIETFRCCVTSKRVTSRVSPLPRSAKNQRQHS